MLLSRKMLQRILGVLWLCDGIFQLLPQMWTMNMVNGIMKPMLVGQPAVIESSLQWFVNETTTYLIQVNLLITVVQTLLGLGFLFLSKRWVKPLVIASIVWALIVWYAGEGMNMMFTGQASILTGAPGAVLLYPLLGLVIWPRQSSGGELSEREEGLLSRRVLRWVLAGFWIFAALLQLQASWWQDGQISQAIAGSVGKGGWDSVLVDPVLQQISNATANIEIPLNIILIVLFLALGIGLAIVKDEQVRPFLGVSLVLSLLFWYLAEGFGMILTGMGTDFNSGLLIVVMALSCWPASMRFSAAHARFRRSVQEAQEAGSTQTG